MLSSLPWPSLFGGMLIGLSASLLLLFNGKVAGISGIVSGAFFQYSQVKKGLLNWRLVFVVAMVAGGFLATEILPGEMPVSLAQSSLTLIVSGLFVGIGTRLGSGCTSGHGICGIGRLSLRSWVATGVFMLIAMITVFFRLHIFG